MGYFRTCPVCGSNLDPGERCDCEYERDKERTRREEERERNERLAITYRERAWGAARAS